MQIEEILRSIYPMSDAGVDLIRPLLKEEIYQKRDMLITQGEMCREIFFVKKGVARNFSICDGKEYTRWFAMDGDLVTSMFGFAKDLPAISSVECESQMEVYTADINDIRRLIVESPEWALWTSQYLIDGLYILERRHTFLGQGDAYTRYVNLLKMRSFKMLNCISLKHIASYLGITQQTLSRVLRQLVREKRM